MFTLLLVNAIIGAEFSCKDQIQPMCEIHPQCAWTSKGCIIKTKACINQAQDSCLNSVDCSWDTCLHQCRPLDLVEHECTMNDNFCRIKIDGKLMTKEMCTVTEGCAWDMCHSSCNQKFLIPSKCQDSPSNCEDLDVGSCFAQEECGWDTCDNHCKNETTIDDECLTRLGVRTVPMTPGMRPGMTGYIPGRMQLKFDTTTGRQYKPYHPRPLMLDRRVWTWLAALPFICMIVFCLGYHFPSGLCDNENNTGGDYLQEGEDILSPPPRGLSQSGFRSGAHASLMNPTHTSDHTTSTIHTMQSSKPASQIRYRGPSKSDLFQKTLPRIRRTASREDESIERERAFDPKRDPRMPHIPESDIDVREYMPPRVMAH